MCEDVPYGKISRPWPMPGPQRARPAGPEHAYPSSGTELPFLAISSLKIAHWLILLRENEGHGGALDENGSFTERKCVSRLGRYGSSGYFFFEKHSLIDFQIRSGERSKFCIRSGPIWNNAAPGRPAGPAEVRA